MKERSSRPLPTAARDAVASALDFATVEELAAFTESDATGDRPKPTAPAQRSGPPRSPQPQPEPDSQPPVQSPQEVHAPQPSSPAVIYSPTSTSGERRDNAVVGRVALVAALAAVIGLVYLWWPHDGAPSEDRSPGGSLLADLPAELPRVGSFTDSRILPNGDIRVDQWVRTRTPMRGIELVVPSGDGLGAAVRATDVTVAGELIAVSPNLVGGSTAVYRFAVPSQIVRLSYTLVGSVVRSPSASGRALAPLTAADLAYLPEDGPRLVRIRAPEVLNVACRARSPEADPKPCGSPAGESWQVTLQGTHRDDEVSAQVNLG
jgi:hypothetical protein